MAVRPVVEAAPEPAPAPAPVTAPAPVAKEPERVLASRRSVRGRTGTRFPRNRSRECPFPTVASPSIAAPAAEAPKAEAVKAEAPKTEAPKAEAPKKEVAKAEAKPKRRRAKDMRSSDDELGGESAVKGQQTLRVNVETLENLMTMVSELVLTRNQLLEIVRRHEESEFKVPLQRLSNVTAELQEGVMKTRMQPIGNAWQKLPRVVRDLGNELGKQIELEMFGAETELDRQVLDLIKDPLTHMVRNSADHGLESTVDRRMAGKPDKGTIRLAAYHEGGHIIIAISDDGRGLNTDRIKRKIIENSLASEAEVEKMTEAQIQKFIFAAGFSTAAGRDIGLWPWRGHGCGAHQYRPDRWHHRSEVSGGRGHHLHHQDSADAGHCFGLDR